MAGLCRQCREINLSKCIIRGTSGPIPLGSVFEILQKREECDFCFLVYEAVRLKFSSQDSFSHDEAQEMQCTFYSHRDNPTCIVTVQSHFSRSSSATSLESAVEPRTEYSATLRQVSVAGTPYREQRRNYRPVTLPSMNFELLRRWRMLCGTLHAGLCANPGWMHLVRPTGLQVIHTKTREIVPAPTDCRYAALSYVWGDDSSNCVSSTLSDLACLPRRLSSAVTKSKTIDDAIRIALELELDYLWVDALCIAQYPASNTNKTHHLKQMDSIYQSADVVLVAAASRHAASGILNLELDSRKNTVREVDGVQLAVDKPMYQNYIRSTHWSRRAWTLQESILARRLIVFGKFEAYWLCQCDEWHESKVLEPHLPEVLGLEGNPRPLPDTSRPPERVFALQKLNFMEDKVLSDRHVLNAYTGLVFEYSTRQLGRADDGLNAVAGILKFLQRVDEERWQDMHYALPGCYFDFALLWDPFIMGRRSPDLCWRQQLPSWSWVGWLSIETKVIRWSESLWDSWNEYFTFIPAIKWHFLDCGGHSHPLKAHRRLDSEWPSQDVRNPCGIDTVQLLEPPPARSDIRIDKDGYFLHFLTTSVKLAVGYRMPRYEVKRFWFNEAAGPYALIDQEKNFAGSIILSESMGTKLVEGGDLLDLIFLSYIQSAEYRVIGVLTKEEPEPVVPPVEIWDRTDRTGFAVLNALWIQRNEAGTAERVQLAKVSEKAWLASNPKTEWIVLG